VNKWATLYQQENYPCAAPDVSVADIAASMAAEKMTIGCAAGGRPSAITPPQPARSPAIPPVAQVCGSPWGRPETPLIVDLLAPLVPSSGSTKVRHSQGRTSRRHELRESVNQREKLSEFVEQDNPIAGSC